MVWMALGVALVTVHLEVLPDPGSPVAIKAKKLALIASVRAPGALQADARPLEIPVPGSWELKVPAGSTVGVRVAGDDLWAPERDILVDTNGSHVVLPLRPTVPVRVTMADGRDLEKVRVVFEESPREASHGFKASGELWIPASLRQPLVFRLPAGRWDLRLSAQGRAPRYFWDVTVVDETDLGTVRLPRAASVSGFVVDAAGRPWGTPVTVTLEPARSQPEAAQGDFKKLQLTTRSGERGFFQFVDVPPGSYLVRAAVPGLAPAEAGPIRVFEGAESRLPEPLALTPPVPLRVFLDAPADPWGAPLRVAVKKAEFSLWGNVRQTVATLENERAELALAPGRYVVSVVSDPDQTWWEEELELASPGRDIFVSLPFVEVAGRVTRGGGALALGEVCFFKGSVRLCVTTEGEGRFRGFLPGPGTWQVAVSSEGSEISAPELEIPKGKKRVVHDIALPATRVRGEVVLESGEPVAGAEVRALRLGGDGAKGRAVARSRDNGSFALLGLSEGTWHLAAVSALGSSDGVLVELGERQEPFDVRLVIRRERELRGTVTYGGVPVPGALVAVLPQCFATGTSSAFSSPTFTDARGRFAARVSASCSQGGLVVLARGYAAFFHRIALDAQEDIAVALEPRGGLLQLDVPAAQLSRLVLVFRGAIVPLPMLERWRRSHGLGSAGETLEIPEMPGGFWMLCPTSLVPALENAPADSPLCMPSCSCGSLLPGDRLRLTQPGG
ncbi:MAG: carboxypeptidase-like regulatory domain-containing protein [Thermoanaerobaculum sp.]